MAAAGPILSVIGLGASIHQGYEAREARQESMRRQQKAQAEATTRAISERVRGEQEKRRVNRKKPDVQTLLGNERAESGRGTGATLLTGPTGVQPNNTLLGGQTKLGM